MIYFDNASTSKPLGETINNINSYLTEKWLNPSSLFSKSQEIKSEINKVRKLVAKTINSNNDEIFFTSGGSESNCWAIQGFVNHCLKNNKKPMVITSSIEHKSIIECVKSSIADFCFIEVDNNGLINVQKLEEVLSVSRAIDYEILVSVQYVNNEIGTIQNIKELARLSHRYGAVFHTDAVQAFGKIPIDVKDLNVDLLSVSGHKINGLKGTGVLYKKKGVDINPLIYGTQENSMRGGTENVIGIISLYATINNLDFDNRNIETFYKDFTNILINDFNCKINGANYSSHLPYIINITFQNNISSEALVYLLELSGIYVSTGSACNSHSNEPSYVLKAIGLSDEECMKTIRISFEKEKITNLYTKMYKFIDELKTAIKLLETS